MKATMPTELLSIQPGELKFPCRLFSHSAPGVTDFNVLRNLSSLDLCSVEAILLGMCDVAGSSVVYDRD